MTRDGATHHLVSTVDDIAWLLNLRGADVDYNPVFLAHLLLERDARDALRRRTARSTPHWRAPLAGDGVQVAPYDARRAALARCRPTPCC